jgi:hypothetical protein
MGRKPKRVAEGDGKKGKKDVFCLLKKNDIKY